jgi:peptidoglycan/xylan/chitin deacetylase (PgdA/CDA1 family)
MEGTPKTPTPKTTEETIKRISESIDETRGCMDSERKEASESLTVTETEPIMEKSFPIITDSVIESESVVRSEPSNETESTAPETEERSELKIPILMYHALTKNADEASTTVITVDRFREQIGALSEAGYTAIFFSDLLGYVKDGTVLPEKPVLITLDDGYLSNLTLGGPVLESYGMKATVAVVGITAGCDTYKDTGEPIYPHFTFEAAKTAYVSGLFDFQSHTYDMHQNELDEDPRKGMLQKENESDEDYIKAIRNDFFTSKTLLESEIGNSCFVIVYPHGKCTSLADSVLAEMGAEISVTVEKGISTVKKGDMSSLRFLCRLNMDDNISGEELILLLQDPKG